MLKAREERERDRAAKEARRDQDYAEIMADLRAAIEACDRGDVKAEEEAIQLWCGRREADGLRAALITDAVLTSSREERWVEVAASREPAVDSWAVAT